MTGGTWVKWKGWGTEILSHVEYGHSETNLTHSHSRWFGRDCASVWLYCCSDDNLDYYHWVSLSRYRIFSLLDSCLGHNVWCLNDICYTRFSKVVDLIASEYELYKKFLIVILEICVCVCHSFGWNLQKDEGSISWDIQPTWILQFLLLAIYVGGSQVSWHNRS